MSQKENSGLRVNYYLAQVAHPQREEQPPYQAECEDIIDALGLSFDEANIFKEIWRTANERNHGKGKEGNNPLRAAQKLVHYSGRILKKAKLAAAIPDSVIVASFGTYPEPVQQASEWTAWNGGPCPVPELQRVEVTLRTGDVRCDVANRFYWRSNACQEDIVSYRLV